MNSRNVPALAIFALFLGFAAQAMAQSKVAKTLLDGWDRNKNGLLEQSEIPEVGKKTVESLAKRNGLDPRKALPIDKLLGKPGKKPRNEEATDDKKAAAKSLAKKTSAESLSPASENLKSQGGATESKNNFSPSAKARPSAAGFGDVPPSAKTAGFGITKQQGTATKSLPEDVKSNPTAEESEAQRRLRFLAKSMLAQHDSNKNGKLEKREWSSIRGNPAASDRNRDGILTSEELEQHLGGFASQEKDRRNLSKSKSSSPSKHASSRRTYRFLTAHERLPKGLPSWFTDRDTNLDGQITLREYATVISPATLDEFRAFDLNNDGLVVPNEYLKSLD